MKNSTIQVLRHAISPRNLSWLISALRQDDLVWQFLETDNHARQAADLIGDSPPDWSPAVLSLVSLNQTGTSPVIMAGELRSSWQHSLEPALRRRAAEALQAASYGEEIKPSSLGQAGLLALALRESRRLAGSWSGFVSELHRLSPASESKQGGFFACWKTALACLYGMIPDQLDLLRALLDCYPSEPAGLDLAFHVLLAAPLKYEEQSIMLMSLAAGLSSEKAVTLALRLESLRPDLASTLAASLPGETQPYHQGYLTPRSLKPLQHLAELRTLLMTAETNRLAGKGDSVPELLQQAGLAARELQASLEGLMGESASGNGEYSLAAGHWQKASELSTSARRTYQARLSGILVKAGQEDAARKQLISLSEEFEDKVELTEDELLAALASIRLALENEDRQLALQLAEKIAAKIDEAPAGVVVDGLQQLAELARIFFNLDLYQAAVAAARRVLEVRPNIPDLLTLQGEAYDRLGEYELAASTTGAAAALDPANLTARRFLAGFLDRAGEWVEAYAEHLAIIENLPAEEITIRDWLALATSALHAGEPDKTVEACQKVLDVDAGDEACAEAHCLYGEALVARGSIEEAQEHFSTATNLQPEMGKTWLALARLQKDTGQPTRALETLRAASLSSPDSPEVQLALGEAHLEDWEGRGHSSPTQALSAFQQAQRLVQGHAIFSEVGVKIALRLGETLQQLGHFPEARQVLEPAFAARPDYPGLAQLFSQTLLALKDLPAAIEPLERVIRGEPEDLQTYLDYATCLLAAQANPQEAVRILRHVLEADAECSEAGAMLAEALEAAGNLTEALQVYQQTLENDYSDQPGRRSRLSFGLGRVALALNNTDIAIAALEEASATSPEDARIARSLSEAYQTAGLLQESIQAAREALRMELNEVDTLEWFARRALSWFQTPPDEGKEGLSKDGIPWSVHLQARSEALNAITQALEYAPERTGLKVLLGKLQISSGDKEDARATFQTVSEDKNASPADLQEAASGLLELGEPAAAVTCLERAVHLLHTRQSTKLFNWTVIFKELIDAHRRTGNIQASLEVLKQALDFSPGDVTLLRQQADLLLELGRPDEALVCLDEALAKEPEACDAQGLNLQAASVLRTAGQVAEAVNRAVQVLQSCKEHGHAAYELRARVLTADLARSMLHAEQAMIALGAPPVSIAHLNDSSKGERASQPGILEYFSLRGELSLEVGDEDGAIECLTSANEIKRTAASGEVAGNRLRLKVLEARLKARDGNTEEGLKGLQAALSGESWELQSSPTGMESTSGPAFAGLHGSSKEPSVLLNNLLAAGEAAVEFGEWDLALFLLRKAGEIAPSEPLSYFKLARALAMRAEAQHLCQDIDAVQHAPGASALAEYARDCFIQALDAASSLVEHWSNRDDEGKAGISEPARKTIERWKVRGLDTFSPGLREELHPDGVPLTPEAIAARIAANRYSLEKIDLEKQDEEGAPAPKTGLVTAYAIQAARIHPQHPLVLGQLALTLAQAEDTLEDSLRAARQCLRNFKADRRYLSDTPFPTTSDQSAIYHALLGKLAYACGEHSAASESILAALEVWAGEPRWHALAAASLRERGEISNAVEHLEQALALEPKHIAHYIALGEAYLLQSPSGITPLASTEAGLARAIQTLEHATNLAPNHLAGWQTLARAYLQSNQLEKAAACADKSLVIASDDPQSQLLAGEIAFKKGNYQEAYDRVQSGAQLSGNPSVWKQQPGVVLLTARALDGLHRSGEALSVLEKAIPTAAHPLPLLLEEVGILEKAEGIERALQLLKELAARFPEEPRVLALLSTRLEEAGCSEEAVRCAQKALQTGAVLADERNSLNIHEQARLHLLLGRVLRQAGQLDQSVYHLDEAIQQEPDSIEGYLEMGATLQERRQHPKALQMYQQATRIAPRDHRPYHQAGLALKESKDYMGAESMLRRAAELAPGDLLIHRQLGAIVALNLVHNRRRRPEE